ncbi:putative acyl-activating enzyme 5, peroxisomal [Acorus gramineus]|uniref:Acyl-activating enzyme 5, peroxisomal n=1 Tax=Acorus gramineus TaxID=55184 RepID=A0AAV9BB90_ACOGR|nr:putative acyl-activating enzyme 5, peroxisomal [Acorus gramineus]
MEALKPTPANTCPLTPLGFIDRAATVYGDYPSVVYNDTVYTWTQTYHRCLRLASSLASMGIRRGDVVSVVAPNVPAMYEMHFGVPMSGAILNNINIRLNAHTVSVLLRHCEAKLVFVDCQSRSLVEEALSLFQKDQRFPLLVFIDDDSVEEGKSLPPSSPTYEGLIEMGDPDFKWVRPESEWEPMILNYTSGTTAAPKGVVHCHRGIFVMSLDSVIDWALPKQPVYLWTLPMFHANGWSFPWGVAAVGGTNICLRRFDAKTVYAAIEKHSVTHMCGAPVVLNMLANAADSDRRPLPGTVQILTAGAPPPAAVLFRTESLGFSVSHGYGLTETAGLCTSCAWKPKWDRLPGNERARLKARQGVRTLGAAEVDVLDAVTGEPVKRDGETVGEIVIRGGSVMLGYLKDPEATAQSIRADGWFYTGDVGVMHADGYVEIKDRSKDVIISGGENISSVEVESMLYAHPAVNEAAVVARPDEFWGETPCAFVSLKEEYKKTAPSEAELIGFCKERMPKYMVPKRVVFQAELPKTSTGKIQKFVLRDMAKALGGSYTVASRM